jgi:hypothetical protein
MYARGHCLVGFIHEWWGHWESAIAPFERAIAARKETNQGSVCGWQLARLYARSGRESEVLPVLGPLTDEARHGWETGGWEGLNRAFADASADPSVNINNICPSLLLVQAGAVEEMYSCFETEMDATVDVPLTGGIGPVLRRLNLVWNIRFADSFRPYRDQPRFQELWHRLDERIQAAAGTYEQKIGSQLTR